MVLSLLCAAFLLSLSKEIGALAKDICFVGAVNLCLTDTIFLSVVAVLFTIFKRFFGGAAISSCEDKMLLMLCFSVLCFGAALLWVKLIVLCGDIIDVSY